MKYQNLNLFEKHLKESEPSPVYLAAVAADFERQGIVDKIICALKVKDDSVTAVRFDAAVHPVDQVLEKLNTKSLFDLHQIICVDRVEKLKTGDLEKLAEYLKNPSPFSHLILSAASSKGLSSLLKRDLVALDLSEEKPWERQKRVQQELLLYAHETQKRVSPEIIDYLITHVGLDSSLLKQEVDKLICYVGEKWEITMSDVRAISSFHQEASGWQIAERAIWLKKGGSLKTDVDTSFFLALIGQVRYQLELGLQLFSLKAHKCTLEEMQAHLPTLKPRLLEERLKQLGQFSTAYFTRGLSSLFEMEHLYKSGFKSEAALWAQFLAKLTG